MTKSYLPFPDTEAAPFHMPGTQIVLDLPLPPPVNKTRRINWANRSLHVEWQRQCDNSVMHARNGAMPKVSIKGRYSIHLLVDDSAKYDLDATVKSLIDYCVRIELVTNDSPKYLRKVTIEWGNAPEGVRLTLEAFP